MPDPAEAITCLERALSLDPGNREIETELATAHERLRAAAVALVDEAQAINHQGDRLRAFAMFQRATQMDPRNDRAWLGCARTTEDMEQALAFTDRALEINPMNTEARELRGWLWTPEEPAPEGPPPALRILSAVVAAAVIVVSLLVIIEMFNIPIDTWLHF